MTVKTIKTAKNHMITNINKTSGEKPVPYIQNSHLIAPHLYILNHNVAHHRPGSIYLVLYITVQLLHVCISSSQSSFLMDA